MKMSNQSHSETNPYTAPQATPVATEDSGSLNFLAMCAIVCSGLSLALLIFALSVSIPNGEDRAPSLGRVVGFLGMFMALPAIGVVGGFSMLRRRRYGLAVAAACGMIVPLFGPCFGLTFPLGIWAIVVLLRPAVRESFVTVTANLAGAEVEVEEALAAASRLDHRGDWDQAIRQYQSIAARWPERAAYAESCIVAIETKRAAGA